MTGACRIGCSASCGAANVTSGIVTMHFRVDTRVKLVHDVGRVRASIRRSRCSAGRGAAIARCGASHRAGRIVAMIQIRVDARAKFVHEIRRVWASIRSARSGAYGGGVHAGFGAAQRAGRIVAVIHIAVDARVSFVGNVGIVRASVG
jgi:hypothetical protein